MCSFAQFLLPCRSANPSNSCCPCGITAGDGGGRGYFSGNKHKVAAPERGHSIPAYDSLQEDMAVKLLILMLTVNYICDGGEMFLR